MINQRELIDNQKRIKEEIMKRTLLSTLMFFLYIYLLHVYWLCICIFIIRQGLFPNNNKLYYTINRYALAANATLRIDFLLYVAA